MMQSGKETSETWTSRLGNILSELTGNNPIIGRVPFDKDRNDDKDKNDAESEASERMLWWRGSVARPDASALARRMQSRFCACGVAISRKKYRIPYASA